MFERGTVMVNAAILGFGTVGSGVAEVLRENAEGIARAVGGGIKVKYILDLRDFPESPFGDLVIHDFDLILCDPEVTLVVETIGGARAAYDYTKRCLAAGKSVVTSNKELVAAHGQELLELAGEKGVSYLFEASVGGGIPIIRPMLSSLAGNRIDEVFGILNGTTNFILTGMIEKGRSFEDMLSEAQNLGYAELDPSADVEGYDAARKICILAGLAFGKGVRPEDVSTRGIGGVTLRDVQYAGEFGFRIKLLGRAYALPEGRAAVYVGPHLIPERSPIAGVDGVMNAIVVHGNAVGECMFYGPGAGKLPTASAVVADMMDAVRDAAAPRNAHWEAAGDGYLVDARDIDTGWYIRTSESLSALRAALGVGKIRALREHSGELAILTENFTQRELSAALGDLNIGSMFMVLG